VRYDIVECGGGRALVNLNDQCWRGRTSPLRHSGQPHALNVTFAPDKESRNVAPCADGITIAANGEARIERKSRLHCGPRFVQFPEPRQYSREMEIRDGIIPICV